MRTAAAAVIDETLILSRSPTSEIAAAALQAKGDAGLDRADFIIVAVEPGRAGAAKDLVDEALAAA